MINENPPLRIRDGMEKKGSKGGIKKEPNAQVLCRKNLDFFPDDRQTPSRREARNHRSEDAKMLDVRPAALRTSAHAGRADQREDARGDAHRDRNPPNPRRPVVLLCAKQRPRSANNKTTTMTRHNPPSCARPPVRPVRRPTTDLGNWRARWLSGTKKCLCSSVERNGSSPPEPR